MDSDAKSTKSEEDSSTKYVLDYYRKFSQNKDLPKYFSGTSVSYLPEIKDDAEIEVPKIVINTNVDLVLTNLDETKPSELGDSSRTSSVMSNRKLEWDSGADIGYSNCAAGKIHKSCSLPILTELKQKQVAFDSAQPPGHHETPKSSGSSDVKLVVYPCSSSSEGNSSGAKCSSSLSSLPEEKKEVAYSSSSTSPGTTGRGLDKVSSTSSLGTTGRGVDRLLTPSSSSSSTSNKILSFKSTLSHLKKKIGLPEAQSTPNIVETIGSESEKISDTPVMKNRDKPVKQLLSKKSSEEKVAAEEEKNTVTDPLQSGTSRGGDCDGMRNIKQSKRVVNLCLTKPVYVECVTSPSMASCKQIQTQTEHLSVGIQTDYISEKELTEIAVDIQQYRNQSMQFLEHHSDEKNTCSTQTVTDMEASKCDSFEFVKPDSSVQNRASKSPSEVVQVSPSSSDVDLAEAVSTSKPENLGADIAKSVYILQKLLRSKKYDPATKKRYAKKIIRKITESKYLEESSTSSELFFPKKTCTKDSQSIPQNKIMQQSTDSSEGSSRHLESKVNISPRKKTLQIKTFNDNIPPHSVVSAKEEFSSPTEIIPVEARDMRKNLFTLTNNEFSVCQYRRQTAEGVKTPNAEVSASNNGASLEKHFDSSSTPKSYQNWKQDKTVSERIVEQKYPTIGDGDYLVNYADKEREYQINWINKEISHLGKLKDLLEKPPVSEAAKKMKKTTSVYSVSREDQTRKDEEKRKFVIETKLGKELSDQRNFQLDGKKFTVVNYSECKRRKKKRPVLADIEVVSSDTTTNIVVTTFCDTCEKRPCICFQLVGDGTKENICHTCGNRSCTCSTLNPIKSCETICLSCHNAPCSCSMKFSNTGAISKRCSLCRYYPCICFGSFKQSSTGSRGYDGQFIAAAAPETNLGGRSQEEFLFSSRSATNTKSYDGCSKCRTCPCLCSRSVERSESSSKGELPSKQSSISLSGSLSKVFVNCKCKTQSRCNCGFVEKLLRHFDKDDLLKDINFEDNSVQTEPEHRLRMNNIGVQTQLNVRNQNLQTSSRQQSKLSQTDEVRKSQDQHQKSGGVESKPFELSSVAIVTESISQRSANTQPAPQDRTTMTVGVKGTSTEDEKKQQYTSVDVEPCENAAVSASVEKLNQKSQASENWTQIFTNTAPAKEKIAFQSVITQSVSTDSVEVPKLTESQFHNASSQTQTENKIPEPSSSSRSNSENLNRDASDHDTSTHKTSAHGTLTRDASTSPKLTRDTSSREFENRVDSSTRKATTGETVVLGPSTRNFSNAHTLSRETSTRDASFRDALINRSSIKDDLIRGASNRLDSIREVSVRNGSTLDTITRDASTRVVSNRPDAIRGASNRETSTHDTLTRDASTRDTLTRDTSTRGTATRDPVSRDASTDKPTNRHTLTRDASTRDTLLDSSSRGTVALDGGNSSPEMIDQNKNSGAAAQIRSRNEQTNKNVRSEECACVCGFIRKVRHRDAGKMEKNAARRENTPTEAGNDSSNILLSSSTSNGTTSSEAVTIRSDTPSLVTCVCCKRRVASDQTSMLRTNNEDYPLCRRCVQKRPILTSVCYTGPEHVCRCAKAAADRFRRVEEYCTCTRPQRVQNGRYCCHCQFKLKRTQQSRNGIAYTLTLEDESLRVGKGSKHKGRKRLEEIKVKVPCPYNRKKRKDRENFSRRRGSRAEMRDFGLEEDGGSYGGSEQESAKEDEAGEERSRDMKKNDYLSLQDYLRKNRPDFIDSAEYRRQAVGNSRSERQQATDDLKLRFIKEKAAYSKFKGTNKLFTEKQMKEITRRNYKKLPEVQQKLNNFREQRLRNADKMIVDIFKRKIQGSVLKGIRSFPIDTNIVDINT
nr:uncharacterized protein LOC111515578 [Leptinotarsa decemlineata]XP_023027563.1 uncharacterized protein LOC111515578 [Leptinotarsa decemlineata]